MLSCVSDSRCEERISRRRLGPRTTRKLASPLPSSPRVSQFATATTRQGAQCSSRGPNGKPFSRAFATASSTSAEAVRGWRNPPPSTMKTKNNKTIFYPGLGETKKNYRSLSEHLIVADIDWNTGKATSSKNCDTIVSFSLGAVFSLDISIKRKLKKLILCSPTPFESLGKCKAEQVIFIIGEKEKFLQKIFKPLCKKNVEMVIVPKADHRINKDYKKVLLDTLKNSVAE